MKTFTGLSLILISSIFLITSCNKPISSENAGPISFKQYKKRKQVYHGGDYYWCIVKINGDNYQPPKVFFNPDGRENVKPFRKCQAGPNPQVPAIAIKMFNDVLQKMAWHILRTKEGKPVFNYLSLSKPKWSTDGKSVFYNVYKNGGKFKECRYNISTGQTTPAQPSEGACNLPLSENPKYITYRSLQDALKNPLDVHILNLSYKNITRLTPQIAQFKNLEVLNLEFNLNLELPAEIGELTQLKILNLRNTFLKKMPSEIKNLTQLKLLDLGGTKLSNEEKKKIAAILPNCKIK